MGHSRGGHIAFRVAQQRPELAAQAGAGRARRRPRCVARSLAAACPPSPLGARIMASAEKVRAGDIDGALQGFLRRDRWRRRLGAAARRAEAATARQRVHADRPDSTRIASHSPRPTRNRSGRRRCSSAAPKPGRVARHHARACAACRGRADRDDPGARHWMFEQAPQEFCRIVLEFLAS